MIENLDLDDPYRNVSMADSKGNKYIQFRKPGPAPGRWYQMKLYGIFPPCFQKERNKGGIFHNGRFLVKFFTIFPTVLDLWVLKNFACGAILIVFLIFMLIAAPFSLFWRPRQANLNCQLPVKPVQNTSDRWWMIYRRRRRFFCTFGHQNRDF